MADPASLLINIAIQAAIGLAIAILTPKQRNEGPRLEDRSVTTSTYGGFCPIGYGTVMVTGNIIWGQDFEEVETVNSQGKFGKIETVTYTYFATFAVALAQREIIDVIRIYADGKRIYDTELDPSSPEEFKKDIMEDLNFTVYRGTEDQQRDPIISAAEGIDNTPAYRGTAYIVFNRMPLEAFGNRIPQLRFVIRFRDDSATSQRFSTEYSDFGNSADGIVIDNHFMVYNHEYDLIVKLNYTNTLQSNTNRHVSVIRPEDGSVLVERNFVEMDLADTGGGGDSYTRLETRGPYVTVYGGGRHHLFELETLRKLDETRVSVNGQKGFAMSGRPTLSDPPGVYIQATVGDARIIEVVRPTGQKEYYYVVGGIGTSFFQDARWAEVAIGPGVNSPPDHEGFSFLVGTGPSQILTESDAPDLRWEAVTRITEGFQYSGTDYFPFTDIYVIQAWNTPGNFVHYGNNGAKRIVKYRITPDLPYVGSGEGPDYLPVGRFFEIPAGTGPGNCTLRYDPESDILVVTNGNVAYGFDCRSDQNIGPQALAVPPVLIWTKTGVEWDTTNYDDIMLSGKQALPFGTFWVGPDDVSQEQLYKVSVTTGEIVEVVEGIFTQFSFPGGDGNEQLALNPPFRPNYDLNALMTENVIYFFGRTSSRSAEPLDEVVEDIVTRGKLSAADIDVTDLATKEVQGYLLNSQMSFRAALEPLATAYNFHAVEKDGKLVFEFRDGDTDVTVVEDDLVQDNRRTVLEEARGQELETPRALFIRSRSPDSDDKIQVQGARRIAAISKTMNSVGEQTLEIPIWLTADEAQSAAERILFESWVSRETFKFRLPQRYLQILPNDVVQFTAEGRTESIRVNRLSIGADLSVEVEGSVVDGEVYVQALPGVDFKVPAGYTEGGTLATLATEIRGFFLDIPLLNDSDMTNREQGFMRWAAAPSALTPGSFPGAAILTSFSGSPQQKKDIVAADVPWGVAESFPDIPNIDFNAVQEATVVVRIYNRADEFTSATEDDMIQQNLNRCIALKANGEVEFFAFRDITDNGDGTYNLTGLIRGQRGTVHGAKNYSTYTGTVYVMLVDNAWLGGYEEDLSRLDQTLDYLILPASAKASTVGVRSKSLDFQSLMPLAVADIRLTSDSGEKFITWKRRDRRLSFWADSRDNILTEDSESYEVDILDGPGGNVLRTLTTDTESVTYHDDDFDADFGTGWDGTLHVRVYQISAQVGRGFTYEAALTED